MSFFRPHLLALLLLGCAGRQGPPNVLFIAVDDLRPEFGAYGRSHTVTPSLDRLASEGLVFLRAYANVPVCGASRASLLTGLRPTRTRFLGYDTRADVDAPEAVTLPEHFRAHGYATRALGKVFHHTDDSPESWSEPVWHPGQDPATRNTTWRDYQIAANRAADVDSDQRGPPYESANVPDSAYYDGKIALRAAAILQELSKQEAPFFLAVGFLKPHLPFNAPDRYWNLYDRNAVELADNPFMPVGAPPQARHNWGELRSYQTVPPAPDPLPDSLARSLIHGYYAAISYTDAQIGQLLDVLDQLGIADNTIVVLWGDHGWQLGEHGLWCKHSPFHNAVHAPLLVRAPGIEGGRTTRALTEFVDIYPSIVELAGLPQPSHLAGTSFVPLLADPDLPGKSAVFPRWRQAESIRTDRYLYTEWFSDTDSVVARMLYDHELDPGENRNISEDSAASGVVAELSATLRKHLFSQRDE